MNSEQTVIPPVEAGIRESHIEIETRSERSYRAVGEHLWSFDYDAYHEITGLDVGINHPSVKQEDGYSLRVRREYRWREILGREGSRLGTMTIEEAGTRGDLMEAELWSDQVGLWFEYLQTDHHGRRWHVVEMEGGGPPYLEGTFYESMMAMVRQHHMGQIVGVPHPDELFERLLSEDSPDGAIPAENYTRRGNEGVVESD